LLPSSPLNFVASPQLQGSSSSSRPSSNSRVVSSILGMPVRRHSFVLSTRLLFLPVAAAAAARSLDSFVTMVWMMDHPASSSSTERVSPSEDRQAFKPAAQDLQAAELVHAVVHPQDLKLRRCRLCCRYLEDHQAHSRPQWDTVESSSFKALKTAKPQVAHALKTIELKSLKFQDAPRFLKTRWETAARPRASSPQAVASPKKVQRRGKSSTPADFKP
ncbi:hypothetical protein C8F04DRAFT_1286717, partial [Mycena alexandri]